MTIASLLFATFSLIFFLNLLIEQFANGIDSFVGYIQIMLFSWITILAYVTLMFKRSSATNVEKMFYDLDDTLRKISFDYRLNRLMWKFTIKFFVDSTFFMFEILYFDLTMIF